MRLVLSGQDTDFQAGLPEHPFDEGRAVHGLAHGGRGGGEDLVRSCAVEDRPEALQGGDRLGHALRGQASGARCAASEARQDLFVVGRPDRTPLDPIEDQAHRIRSNVDDGNVTGTQVTTSAGRHGRRPAGVASLHGRDRTGLGWS